MPSNELRGLRSQIWLMGGLFALSVVTSATVASQRWFFEKHCRERYSALPSDLRRLATSAAEGALDPNEHERLSREDRLALYDDWMAAAEPLAGMAKALLAHDPALYIARAERTLVCGRADQRSRAIEFVELGGSAQAVPMLRRARSWWTRRNDPGLAERLDAAIERLESTENESSTFPSDQERVR